MSAASSDSAASSAASLASAVLARERARMALADAQSFVAQRFFVGSVQVPQTGPILSWEDLYNIRHDDFHMARGALMAVRSLLQQDRHAAALAVVHRELGEDEEDEEAEMEEAEEEQQDNDPEVEVDNDIVIEQLVEAVQLPMAQPTAAPPVQAFTGCFYRLDTEHANSMQPP